ncbi:Codeine 3-O-demethylase protein [Dioscorea alata]|uniref:Codeine 3-O-demethylase protein n=1 Tax=Dioscorea alata TaxID=55571 RepID=A0ACB7UKF3_DIOAL|nr:Codeine 3-O-demethylase protein [Dioscorea alata]
MSLKIDPAFIQPAEHCQKPTISDAGAATIPLIDLSPLLHHQIPSDPSDPAIPDEISSLIAAIGAACRDWGFFQVINHGVDPQLLERIQAAAMEFFALPAEEKRKVKRDEVNPLGYYDSEYTKNVRDWKEVFDLVVREYNDGLLSLKNRWPEYPPAMRETCEEYIAAMEKLSYKLVELISLSLNLLAKRLNGFFKDSSSYFRLNYYNPCPMPDLVLGIGRHKDSGALTILYQDQVGGLDVKRKSDGEWVRVKPIPNSYVINVGNVFQVWTNERYESVEHRASVNSEKARLSIPFFLIPTFSTNVKPLEELVTDENPAKYEEYNWRDYLISLLESKFKKMDKESIQISQFKKTTI